jgi:hypothetical protein
MARIAAVPSGDELQLDSSRARHTRAQARATIVVCAAVALAGAACGSSRAADTTPAASHTSAASRALVVLVHHIGSPAAYATPLGLYVYDSEPAALRRHTVRTELRRIDSRSGRVLAHARLTGTIVQTLIVGADLWVTTKSGPEDLLTVWRLAPTSLTIRSLTHMPVPKPTGFAGTVGYDGSMASAGGWIWVADVDRIVRLASANGSISAVVMFPNSGGLSVTGDGGRTLMALGGSDLVRAFRLNPVDGSVLATSKPFLGAGSGTFGGIIDGGIWMYMGTGHLGFGARMRLPDLRTTPTPFEQRYTTQYINVHVVDGFLAVSGVPPSVSDVYCADPVTGRSRARLHSAAGDNFLTADSHHFILARYRSASSVADIVSVPVDPRCTRARQ